MDKKSENDLREAVRDYLNSDLKEAELMNMFEIVKCSELSCTSPYQLEEDMVYHKWDINETEEKICKDCRNDE